MPLYTWAELNCAHSFACPDEEADVSTVKPKREVARSRNASTPITGLTDCLPATQRRKHFDKITKTSLQGSLNDKYNTFVVSVTKEWLSASGLYIYYVYGNVVTKLRGCRHSNWNNRLLVLKGLNFSNVDSTSSFGRTVRSKPSRRQTDRQDKKEGKNERKERSK